MQSLNLTLEKSPVNEGHSSSIRLLAIEKIDGIQRTYADDVLAVEEPLEIRLDLLIEGRRTQKSISITMRTPGHDFELALGFLFTEGILRSRQDFSEISHCGPASPSLGHSNVVKIKLADDVTVDLARLERHFYTSSSCGVCGKSSLDALKTQSVFASSDVDDFAVDAHTIHRLPAILRAAQEIFDQTGGLHASALFDEKAQLTALCEDVGRHNALDKVIGAALLNNRLPLSRSLLLVSGRLSFELVQKAAMAGIKIIAAVGAPSSLAVELAKESGICLLGFVRQERYNIYATPSRILKSELSPTERGQR